MTEETVITIVEKYQKTMDWDTEKKVQLRENAIAALGEYLYMHIHRFKLDYVTEDTRSDFIVYLYPRFGTIIDQYDVCKATFGTYIRSIIRLSYRTFTRDKYGYEARQKIYEIEEVTRLLSLDAERECSEPCMNEICEDEITYAIQRALNITKHLSKKKKEIHARKIFLLACKTGCFLDDTLIDKIAGLTNFSIEYIKNNLETTRNAFLSKAEKHQHTAEKLNGFYIRYQRCKYELKYLDKDSARYYALEKEYQYCLKRWTSIRKQTSYSIRSPSNRFLSGILGLSRGTIDSTLASVSKPG